MAYIHREKFLKNCAETFGHFGVLVKAIEEISNESISDDVVEVGHGTWYHGTEYGAVYAKCSACGRKMNYSCYGYAYCALCGARMDGATDNNVGDKGVERKE